MGKKAISSYEKKNRAIVGTIEKYQRIGAVPAGDMGVVIGVSRRTWSNRRQNPGSLTLDELRAISRQLRIPPEELLHDVI